MYGINKQEAGLILTTAPPPRGRTLMSFRDDFLDVEIAFYCLDRIHRSHVTKISREAAQYVVDSLSDVENGRLWN